MRFGPVPSHDAAGALLAHGLSGSTRRYKKGHVLSADDVADLQSCGHTTLIVAQLDADDVVEDTAAERLAKAVIGHGDSFIDMAPAFTGRVNLYAREAGLFEVNEALVNAINAIDPSFTFATLPNASFVEAGRMVATVKIIPFAVSETHLAAAEAVARKTADAPVVMVHPPKPMAVGYVTTTLPSLKSSVMDKTRRTLQARLGPLKGSLLPEARVVHEEQAVADALLALPKSAGLIVLFGASAITDEHDVLPSALRRAGGIVERVGMPVDPGNLIMVGRLGKIPVIGAPGCARSPAENGFDWVLQRFACGLPVTSGEISGWGVGGLLMEIITRPQPRDSSLEPEAIRDPGDLNGESAHS